MKSWDWEEKAFAKDGGSFGVCTWPPRSYTCSFCTRDFKSAQALGGHMNIHRRDRAKLKQSLIGLHSDHHHHQPSCDQQNHLISSKPMISIDFTNINIKVVDPAAPYSYSSAASSTTHEVASSDFVSPSLCRSQKKQRIGEYPFLSNFPCLDTTVRLMTTLEYSKPKNIINPRDNIVSVETDLSTVGLDSEVIHHELKTTTAATNLDLELKLG